MRQTNWLGCIQHDVIQKFWVEILYKVSPKKEKLLKSLIVKMLMPYQTAKRNDA
jgi:hypothetical protein